VLLVDSDLTRLQSDLTGYKHLLLPLNKVLEWEEPHYPGALVGIVTFMFAIIWYLEPSVLTCFSLMGLVMCLIDFVVPTVTSYCFSTSEWGAAEEGQYEAICSRMLHARQHISNAFTSLNDLKKDKPKAYLLVMMGIFAMLAWIGSLMDNLLLTYLFVVFVMLIPGLRRHGILQKATKQIKEAITKALAGMKGKEGAKKK